MDGRPHRALLSAGRWFSALPGALQDALIDGGVVRALVDGERLFSRGDAPDGLYAMLDGAVRITATTESGKEALLTLQEAPSWFGEIAVFDRQPRTHDAVADGPAKVLRVPQAALDAHLDAHPQHWRDLGLLMTQKLRLAFLALEDAMTQPLVTRLARRLVMMAEGYGDRQGSTARALEVSQEQLASMLSTSRQSMNQALKDFEQRGLVRLAYGEIVVADLDGLRALAGG